MFPRTNTLSSGGLMRNSERVFFHTGISSLKDLPNLMKMQMSLQTCPNDLGPRHANLNQRAREPVAVAVPGNHGVIPSSSGREISTLAVGHHGYQSAQATYRRFLTLHGNLLREIKSLYPSLGVVHIPEYERWKDQSLGNLHPG